MIKQMVELEQRNKELEQTCKRLESLINNVACDVNNIQRTMYKELYVNRLMLDYATEIKIPADLKAKLNRIYGINAIPKETKEELLKIYRKEFSCVKERKEN